MQIVIHVDAAVLQDSSFLTRTASRFLAFVPSLFSSSHSQKWFHQRTMATATSKKPHLPDELLKHIFSFLQPPSPEALGRARYEHIGFADENAEAVNQYAVTNHENLLPKLKTNDEQYKLGLSTLSNCTRACKRFERIARPLLYEHYPGQPIAGLQAFNRTLVRRPDLARMVKYTTIGCWEINMMSGLERFVFAPSHTVQT